MTLGHLAGFLFALFIAIGAWKVIFDRFVIDPIEDKVKRRRKEAEEREKDEQGGP